MKTELLKANDKLLTERTNLANQQLELVLLTASRERYGAGMLKAAFGNGIIDGKNAELRTIQKDNLLLNDKGHNANVIAVEEAKKLIGITTAQIKYLETYIKIGLAVLAQNE